MKSTTLYPSPPETRKGPTVPTLVRDILASPRTLPPLSDTITALAERRAEEDGGEWARLAKRQSEVVAAACALDAWRRVRAVQGAANYCLHPDEPRTVLRNIVEGADYLQPRYQDCTCPDYEFCVSAVRHRMDRAQCGRPLCCKHVYVRELLSSRWVALISPLDGIELGRARLEPGMMKPIVRGHGVRDAELWDLLRANECPQAGEVLA